VSVRAVVVDVEGTTSATAAVHGGLYDYARPRLRPWIEQHADDPEVAAAVAAVRAEAGLDRAAGVAEVVDVLHRWMAADVKATPLKTLQGRIWAAGFAAGELTAHFFADVPPRLREWHQDGLTLAVFSSGSVASQRAWFAHGEGGDLSGLIGGWFDTVNAGPKRQPESFARITAALGIPPAATLFLSDVPAELDAAAASGWAAIGVRRAGEPAQAWEFGSHPVVTSFAEVDVHALAAGG
jgi:enolase-phosphatase E1